MIKLILHIFKGFVKNQPIKRNGTINIHIMDIAVYVKTVYIIYTYTLNGV